MKEYKKWVRFQVQLRPLCTKVVLAAMVVIAFSNQARAANTYEPLQEALPALPDELRLGSKYVPGTATKYVRGYANKYDLQEWQEIPNWLAGTWRSTEQIRYLSENEINGEVTHPKSSTYLGWLRDRKGNIWHYVSTPNTNHMEGDNYYRIEKVVYDKMRVVSPDQVSLLIRSSSTEYRKSDKLAFRSYQQEGFYIYSLAKDGTLTKRGWCNHYDEDGILRHRGFDVVHYERVAPFAPVEEYQGEDMRKNFKEYLTSQHLKNLVPN